MSIQAVSFGKTVTTKKGNEYKKTHAGTIAGAAVGLGLTGVELYKLTKTSKLKRIIADAYSKLKETMPKEQAAKFAKRTAKAGLGVGIAVTVLAYLGLGALVNKGINHYRAKSADKAAQTEKPETEKV